MTLFTYYTYYIAKTHATIEENVVPTRFLHGYYNLLQPTTFLFIGFDLGLINSFAGFYDL